MLQLIGFYGWRCDDGGMYAIFVDIRFDDMHQHCRIIRIVDHPVGRICNKNQLKSLVTGLASVEPADKPFSSSNGSGYLLAGLQSELFFGGLMLLRRRLAFAAPHSGDD